MIDQTSTGKPERSTAEVANDPSTDSNENKSLGKKNDSVNAATNNVTEEPTRPKRRLKTAPQSLREQSEIATAKAGKAGRRGIVSTVLGAPFRLIARIFRPLFSYLNKYKFFRVIGYIFVPPYFRSAWRELRLVVWPNFRQTRDLTFAVLVFSIIFGVFVAIIDWGLDKVFRKVFLQQ